MTHINIYFETQTNHQYCYINLAVFADKETGNKVFIDREKSYLEFEAMSVDDDEDLCYELSMVWVNCYIWDPESSQKIYGFDISKYKFIEFEIEDDVPDVNYDVQIISYRGYESSML